MRCLLLYATHHGQTARIAQRMADTLTGSDADVCTFRFGRGRPPSPARFDMVIAGGCVRYGRHDRRLAGYLRRHADQLSSLTTGVFSVDLIAQDPTKSRPSGNVYLRKLIARIGFDPDMSVAFAGRLDYPRYRGFDRWMIRMIMRKLGGPTDPNAVVEYTDFDAVDRFSTGMLKLSHRTARPSASGTEDR
jgi:menaquinone-dependent protoporphyrinogen oxidase